MVRHNCSEDDVSLYREIRRKGKNRQVRRCRLMWILGETNIPVLLNEFELFFCTKNHRMISFLPLLSISPRTFFMGLKRRGGKSPKDTFGIN